MRKIFIFLLMFFIAMPLKSLRIVILPYKINVRGQLEILVRKTNQIHTYIDFGRLIYLQPNIDYTFDYFIEQSGFIYVQNFQPYIDYKRKKLLQLRHQLILQHGIKNFKKITNFCEQKLRQLQLNLCTDFNCNTHINLIDDYKTIVFLVKIQNEILYSGFYWVNIKKIHIINVFPDIQINIIKQIEQHLYKKNNIKREKEIEHLQPRKPINLK